MKAQLKDEAELFNEIFDEEMKEVQRRRLWPQANENRALEGVPSPRENLVGMAMSGGGIRSATFCLGLLQGMHKKKLLRSFDYLSTVSGGGYLGGWWSAWLSRQARGKEDIFPPSEMIEPIRSKESYLNIEQPSVSTGATPRTQSGARSKTKIAESSINAGKDPIHHLRLFANYLTPRKGFLSMDTWRAVTIFTRNIILTWLVMLPVLIAVILFGQLYFVLYPSSAGNFPHPIPKVEQSASTSTEQKIDTSSIFNHLLHEQSASTVLQERYQAMRFPAIIIITLIIIAGSLWLTRNQSGSLMLTTLNTIIVLILLFIFTAIFIPEAAFTASDLLLLSIVLFLLVMVGPQAASKLWRMIFGKKLNKAEAQWQEEVRRNRLIRFNARLLVTLLLLVFVLAVSGFGHELIEFSVAPVAEGTPYKKVLNYLLKSVSLSALFTAIAGLIFTGAKTSPAGGGDQRETIKPSAVTQLIFTITPPLVLIVLVIFAAWIAHALLWHIIVSSPGSIQALTVGALVGVALSTIMAFIEMEWQIIPSRAGKTLLFILLVFTYSLAQNIIPSNAFERPIQIWALRIIAVSGSLIFFKLLMNKIKDWTFFKRLGEGPYRLICFLLILLILTGLSVLAAQVVGTRLLQADGTDANVYNYLRSMTTGLACFGVFYLFISIELVWGRRQNKLAFRLLNANFLVLVILLVLGFVPPNLTSHPHATLARVVIGLIAAALAWVVAIGWLTDPNALSIHAFYKARLTRAFLGASNQRRAQRQNEITESVEGDDELLSDLKNVQQGAPYLLINTTLNLVGGRDLATSQRASAMFIFSKLYCGSLRTGYRLTNQYMNGELTLGTAISISGAAVSPNMGAIKTSTPLAMLMTLLNLRLGYWAPTPSESRWRASQARLWPYYTLREFLSQTNDLSTYCYLTDGGHFDNTGLYSLVERGCRFIVVADCGADPSPCFQDLGDAIRRCRIDFGAEISLDITQYLDNRADPPPCIVGKITYSLDHVKKLEWDHKCHLARTGFIIVFKPSRVADAPTDVLQYGLENPQFPHQTTADQWYDEAQFEAYRRLGQHCAEKAFDALPLIKSKKLKGEVNPSPSDIETIFNEAWEEFGQGKPDPNDPVHSS